MLDLELVAAFFRAINWASVQRLILVGDPNQLPPIERGRVFADIIDWLQEHNPESVGLLTTNIRQMENRLKGEGTSILDLASLYVRTKQGTGKDEGIKFNAESILRRIHEGGDIDKYLRIVYWQNSEELAQKLIFQLKRFQAIFSRKDQYWVDYESDEVEENLELAYAISVHKSQGSEFERVYFILPKDKMTLLSRELFYTGITRAKRHCTIFVQEDIAPLLNMRRPEKSQLVGINASLFSFHPVPADMETMHEWYEEGKIHQTLADIMVRSKSEVIIANIFAEREIPFQYEVPLYAPDGTFYLPDFTIIWGGESWYWEHLGLLNQEEYHNHWKKKSAWYKKFFPGRLIITEESGDLSKEVDTLIQEYFS